MINKIQQMTDEELIRLVKEEADNEAILEICRRYENIFYKICQKYVAPLTSCGININDIFGEKYYLIFHCVVSFDNSRNTKLSTWIGNYARYLCLNSISSRRFIIPSSDEDVRRQIEAKQVEETVNHKDVRQEELLFINNILSQIRDTRIKDIFEKRYAGKKMIWSDIANSLGISTQTAINLHAKGLRIIKKKIKSKFLADTI